MAAGLASICKSDLPACWGDAVCLHSEASQHCVARCTLEMPSTPVHGTYCKQPSVTAAKAAFSVPDPVSRTAEAAIFLLGLVCLLPVSRCLLSACSPPPTGVCCTECSGFGPYTTWWEKWPDWFHPISTILGFFWFSTPTHFLYACSQLAKPSY